MVTFIEWKHCKENVHTQPVKYIINLTCTFPCWHELDRIHWGKFSMTGSLSCCKLFPVPKQEHISMWIEDIFCGKTEINTVGLQQPCNVKRWMCAHTHSIKCVYLASILKREINLLVHEETSSTGSKDFSKVNECRA